MSVSNAGALGTPSAVRYTPFRGADRRGPVGTVQGGASATGTASGGGVTLRITTVGQEYGFPWLMALTSVQCTDTLATPENVLFGIFGDPANARVQRAMSYLIEPKPAAGLNVGVLQGGLPAIELPGVAPIAANNIFSWDWATNEDTKFYIVSFYGILYDVQYMTRFKDVVMDGPILGAR